MPFGAADPGGQSVDNLGPEGIQSKPDGGGARWSWKGLGAVSGGHSLGPLPSRPPSPRSRRGRGRRDAKGGAAPGGKESQRRESPFPPDVGGKGLGLGG